MDLEYLINRVLTGHATEEERDQLEKWKLERPANIEEFESLKLLWTFSQQPDAPKQTDSGFYDGLINIRAQIENKNREKKKIRRRNILLARFSGVAIFVIALFLIRETSFSSHAVLKFDDMALGSVIKTIEREYNVVITVNNRELLACRFTGIFYGKYPAPEVIETLASALELECESQSQGNYRLTGAGCKP